MVQMPKMNAAVFNRYPMIQSGSVARGGARGAGGDSDARAGASSRTIPSLAGGGDSPFAPMGLTNETHGGGYPFTPTMTQTAVNAARADATIDPHWLRSRSAQSGVAANSPNVSMGMLPALADSFNKQGMASAMIPLSDALANNQFRLGQLSTNAGNSLSQQNIAAGVQASQQSALLSLLNAIMGG